MPGAPFVASLLLVVRPGDPFVASCSYLVHSSPIFSQCALTVRASPTALHFLFDRPRSLPSLTSPLRSSRRCSGTGGSPAIRSARLGAMAPNHRRQSTEDGGSGLTAPDEASTAAFASTVTRCAALTARRFCSS